MMNKYFLGELAEQSNVFDNPFALFLGLGFDERKFSVLENIGLDLCCGVHGIVNFSRTEINNNYREHPSWLALNGKAKVLEASAGNSILDLIDIIQPIFRHMLKERIKIVIDTTALSHELLVVIVGLLANEKALEKATFLYTGASEYSYNLPEEKMWLSRGVVNVRSILGFPGIMLPSKRLHLIVMAGFEVERAAEVIARLEPSRLTIAYGGRDGSVSPLHHDKNRYFASKIKGFIEDQEAWVDGMLQFEFSCIDPIQTAVSILNFIKKYPEENCVICPLNTKLSTVGAALAALADPRIQICYAQVVEYNCEGYAKPSNCVTVVNLAKEDMRKIAPTADF